jgi:hypothetical protein
MRVANLRTYWLLVAVCCVWLSIAHTFYPKTIIETQRVLEFSLAAGSLVAFWPDFRDAMRKRLNQITTSDGLSVALWLVSLGFFGSGLWSLLWRVAGQPAWMINSDVQGAILACFVVGLTVLLSAPGIKEGRVPSEGRWRVAVWWTIAIAIVGGLAALQPEPVKWLEYLKPLVAEQVYEQRVYGNPTPLPGPP